MSSITIDLFAEDRAHEALLMALVDRLSTEEGRVVRIRIRSAQGGHPRVLNELNLYQQTVLRGVSPIPDILVVAIDSNCRTYQDTRRDIEASLKPQFQDRGAFACPDPHIERWFMADPESFATIVGAEPRQERRKCERDRYKRMLVDAIRAGGHIPTLGGIEFASEIVAGMDLYRAGKNEPSLKSFIDGARASLRRARDMQGD